MRLNLNILALVISLASFEASGQPAPSFSREHWLADYAFLKNELQRSYSHLAWFGSVQGGVDLPALDRQTLQSLQTARSDDEASGAILEFVNAFHDGHFARAPTPAAETAGAPEEPAQASSPANAATACAAYGYGPVNRVQFSLPFETLNSFTLLSDGLTTAFRAGTIESQGKLIGIVRISRFRPTDFAPLCLQAWDAIRAQGQTPSSDTVRDEAQTTFLRVLAERLGHFREAHVNAVIVDIGGNGGGNDLGDWSVRAFTAAPVHSAPLFVTAGPAGAAYLDEQIEQLRDVLTSASHLTVATRRATRQALAAFSMRRAQANDTPCDMSWVWIERRDWDAMACKRLIDAGFASGQYDYAPPNTFDGPAAGALYWASIADQVRGAWDGKTFVLTNQQTGSAAEMFAALMHDRGIARTVGEHTFGLGCGFMDDTSPIVLPHSRLAFRAPNCVRLRGDGSDEVAGVSPDIPATPLAGESARAQAARVIGLIARAP